MDAHCCVFVIDQNNDKQRYEARKVVPVPVKSERVRVPGVLEQSAYLLNGTRPNIRNPIQKFFSFQWA
jgi:hypothetical protein